MIALTCNEVQRLFAALVARPGIGCTGCAGGGDVGIKPAPAPATTDDKPPCPTKVTI
jgi:hypothetical protein